MNRRPITDNELREFDRRMALQNAEFDTLRELIKQWRRVELTPVVDDDYPEVRHGYESALSTFIDALRANGRLR